MAIRLQEIREEKHLSQTELSRRAGVHRTMINRYEHGKSNPSLAAAKKIAAALEVPIGDLLEERGTA